MSIEYVTPHFTWQEFACHDGSQVPDILRPNTRRLCAEVLEKVRARWGGALVVISGYRSPAHNAAVGGAGQSQHMEAAAADVRCASLDELPKLRALLEQMLAHGELPVLGGFGAYPGWIHLDVRLKPASGHVARWMGSKVGDEVA